MLAGQSRYAQLLAVLPKHSRDAQPWPWRRGRTRWPQSVWVLLPTFSPPHMHAGRNRNPRELRTAPAPALLSRQAEDITHRAEAQVRDAL
jgi:hypothetical protein